MQPPIFAMEEWSDYRLHIADTGSQILVAQFAEVADVDVQVARQNARNDLDVDLRIFLSDGLDNADAVLVEVGCQRFEKRLAELVARALWPAALALLEWPADWPTIFPHFPWQFPSAEHDD